MDFSNYSIRLQYLHIFSLVILESGVLFKFKSMLLLGLLLLFSNNSWGQQVIGSFPTMDGGFEGQTSNPATLSGITSAQTAWTSSTSAGVGVLSSTGGRSGPKFITYTQTGTSHRRLQSPTADMPLGAYRIQFWYQGDLDGTITINEIVVN